MKTIETGEKDIYLEPGEEDNYSEQESVGARFDDYGAMMGFIESIV